jgi:hypothetical protein
MPSSACMPDPNQSLYKSDFLCSCVHTRVRFSHLLITPDDLLVTLCGSLYFKYVRKRTSNHRNRGMHRIGSVVHCSGCEVSRVVDKCKLISMSCVDSTRWVHHQGPGSHR